MQEMHKQMELLQQLVTECMEATSTRPQTESKSIKLTCLSENDDIEVYRTTFVHMMMAYTRMTSQRNADRSLNSLGRPSKRMQLFLQTVPEITDMSRWQSYRSINK